MGCMGPGGGPRGCGMAGMGGMRCVYSCSSWALRTCLTPGTFERSCLACQEEHATATQSSKTIVEKILHSSLTHLQNAQRDINVAALPNDLRACTGGTICLPRLQMLEWV